MESLTRPFFHPRRKLSSLNSSSNGLSFSGKDAYDGVLLGAPKSKLGVGGGGASRGVVAVEDYAEIFGGGGGGGNVKRGSSIPVLDLLELDRGNSLYDSQRFNGKLDYSKIFGSFETKDDEDVGKDVPPYEELFGGVKKAKCGKAKTRSPADTGSPLKGAECFNSSKNNGGGFSSEASDQFLGGEKQLNMSYHKTSQRAKDGSSGTTHVAQLHAVPGFTYFVDEAACQQKTEHDRTCPQVKPDAIHSRSSSADLSEGKSSRRGKWKLPDRQASKGLVNNKDDVSWGAFDLKPYASKVPMPSSSSVNSNDNQGHPKRAKSSSFGPKDEASEKDSNGYLSSFGPKAEASGKDPNGDLSSFGPKAEASEKDPNGYLSSFGAKAEVPEKDSTGYISPDDDEELDINSAAAASAAALKKAIQQAQESIRIAKELMERKKDAVQNSKSRVNGSLKVKNKKEIKHDQDMSGFRKNNTEEAHKTISSVAQAFGESDQKTAGGSDEVASGFTCRENHSVGMKDDTEKHKLSAAVTEEQGVGTWFSQLLNNGKNKMAALASQLVDNRNTIFQPMIKQAHYAEEAVPAKDTVERGTTELGDSNAKLDALGNVPDSEKNLDKSVSGHFLQVGTGSVTLISSQKDQNTVPQYGFRLLETCEYKLQDCEKTTYERHFEPEILENGCPAKESRNMIEMKKEEEKFELEIRRQFDDVPVCPENESSRDEKQNRRTQEDSCLQKGNEHKPKEDTAIESSEKKQESSQDEDFSRNSSEGYQEDIDEQRSTCSLDKVENKNISEEENLFDRRPTMTYQNEGRDSIDACAYIRAESENVKVNLEDRESYAAEGEPDESIENPRFVLSSVSADEVIFNTCKNDESTVLKVTPGVSEVNNTSKQTRELEVTVLEEDDDQIGAREEENGHIEFEEDKEEREHSVEKASVIKENKLFETSSLDQCVSQERVVENKIQDAPEALASDDNSKEFDCNTTIHEERPSTDVSLLKTTVLNTEEHDFENDNASEAPSAGEKTSDCEFADMNGEKEFEESDEESEADAENIKDGGIACDREGEICNVELDNKEEDYVEEKLETECSQIHSETKESEEHLETGTEMKPDQSMESYEENICKTSAEDEKENRERVQIEVKENELVKKIEVDQREREREKDRIAVERAIREARERAFAEARERAERAAVERANAEVRQRAIAGAREKLEKVPAGTKASVDKASTEAKLKAERAAVERATAEARERALEKALSQKSTSETRSQAEKIVAGKSSAASRDAGLKHSFSSSDLEGSHNESAQRRKARLERHQRIMERAAKALAEKNMRDILAQREQAERNRLAETLDADIKRWASGKEGNLRALLSTLQYILGPDSGWQAISLTEIITTIAVKKAYRKATLYVHPDKLQQRGASIHQKYICEKVFDLLKAAWNKFNSEER